MPPTPPTQQLNSTQLDRFKDWLSREYQLAIEQYTHSLSFAKFWYWVMQQYSASPYILLRINQYSQQMRIYSEYSQYLKSVLAMAEQDPGKLSQCQLLNPVRSIARQCGLVFDDQNVGVAH
jgi:hypothetical protein